MTDRLEAEQRVGVHSAELKKELRLGDLALAQIVYITGLTWMGTAGKLGPAHVTYWIPAVLLFYVPSAIVVVHLNREMPLEGGLYQWAKIRFGGLVGFLVALNLWASLVLNMASSASVTAVALSYVGGPSWAWVAESKTVILIVAAIQMGGLTLSAVRGLGVAKWIQNVGGASVLIILAAMVAAAVPRWMHGEATVAPFAFTAPALTLVNVNLLGKMGFGAFCGFDGVAVFAGELRNDNAARTIRRSVVVAAPLIVLVYILGTASVLAFTRPDDIDLVAPGIQALSKGAFGASAIVVPIAVALTLLLNFGCLSVGFNAGVRLPMVAGWDHLLPGWLSRLHPRYKTPVGSALLIGGAAFTLSILGSLDVGAQEAFQLLFSANLICWGLAYLVMFAIPIAAKAPIPIRIAAASGFGMTLLFVVLSVFPVVDVANVASFAMKVGGVVVGINVAGALYFRNADARRARAS